jgi:hypothetical protein
MKLLFEITDADSSSDDIKSILGFLDADYNFKNIKPDLITATNEVVNIISKEVYDYIADLYPVAEDQDSFDYQLQEAIRNPIAINAYRMYAPSNDLSHTNDGRKMRNEEHEKNAFQWMIDSDNAAHEKRYYRALDDLIQLLDASKIETETAETIYAIWTTSDEYKASHSLFIKNTREFDRYVVIESRYLYSKLCPGIEECELEQIIPIIGQTKYDEIKTTLLETTPIEDGTIVQLLNQIRKACANYAMAWAIPRFSINLLPDSVVQQFTSDRNTTKASATALKQEPEFAMQAYNNAFKKAIINIQNLVKEKPEDVSTIPILPNIIDAENGFSI